MSSELIINSSRDKSRIGLLKDKKLVEFHQESDETKFNVGDIYVGKVKKTNKYEIYKGLKKIINDRTSISFDHEINKLNKVIDPKAAKANLINLFS